MLNRLAFIVASLLTTPLLAQAGMPRFAETAADLGNAIKVGEDLRQRADLPPLSEAEYDELASLAGCDSALVQGGGSRVVTINWSCGADVADPEKALSTTMFFDSNGKLYGFATNAINKPTETAANAGDLPSRYKLTKSFAKAVVSGGDVTVGDLVPLGEYERTRLAAFERGNFRVSRRPDRDARTVRFSAREGDKANSARIHVFFDSNDRPVGIMFAPTFDPNWVAPTAADRDGFVRNNRGSEVYRSAAQPKCGIC